MSATISKCGLYRYTLERRWGQTDDVLWVMLNPSTADAETNDRTIDRCIAFSKGWGYGGLMVGNLYAYRATKPADLWDAAGNLDIKGWENDSHLCRMAASAALVMCAWGAQADQRRAAEITRLLDGYRPLFCLGRTKQGFPVHPLYQPGTLTPMAFTNTSASKE